MQAPSTHHTSGVQVAGRRLLHRTRLVRPEVCHAAQVMPINPGDLACCRLGGAAGEDGPAPLFTPGQDGVGLVLKARRGNWPRTLGLVALQPGRAWRGHPSGTIVILQIFSVFRQAVAAQSMRASTRLL
jgi:hypothetical protein